MSRKWVLVPALLAIAFAGALFLRSLTEDRDLVASTPSPRPVFTVTYVDLPQGRPLCIGDVTIPHDARRLRVQVRTYGRPGPALSIALSAPGYKTQLTVPAGYPDGQLVDAPLTPPRTSSLGQVCLRQASRARTALVGSTEERTQSRPQSQIDGQPVVTDSYLAFYRGREAGALSQTPAIVARMGAFKPGIVGPWLLWPLLALVVAGVPAGVVWAALRAARA
jgi:hypothetical protein